MAKLIDLLTFSGTVGDMVGCNGPYGFYIRSRPRKSTKAPSPRQMAVRTRLALVMGFLKPLKAIIYRGFANGHAARTKIAALNAATSHALNHAITGEFPDLQIDPANVRLSRGNLPQLAEVAMQVHGTSVTVSWWQETAPVNVHADDEVTVVVYNPQEETVLARTATWISGTLSVDVSDEPAGSELLVYACVCDRTRRKFANSQFLGRALR